MMQTLERRLAEYRGLSMPDSGAFRVAVLGIGNDLNADDAAGVLAARAVMQSAGAAAGPTMAYGERPGVAWMVIDAGPSPESYTGPLRRFAPRLVVMVDAAQMGEPPGTIRVFDWPEAEGLSASTHTMPPSMLARFLTAELGCRVALVGIQAARLEFGEPVSEPVRQAVDVVHQAICRSLLDVVESAPPGTANHF